MNALFVLNIQSCQVDVITTPGLSSTKGFFRQLESSIDFLLLHCQAKLILSPRDLAERQNGNIFPLGAGHCIHLPFKDQAALKNYININIKTIVTQTLIEYTFYSYSKGCASSAYDIHFFPIPHPIFVTGSCNLYIFLYCLVCLPGEITKLGF